MIDKRVTLVRDPAGNVVGFRDLRFGSALSGDEYSFTDPLWAPYLHCRVCGKSLNEVQILWGLSRLAPVECSPECCIRQQVCCGKATLIACVCHLSWTCPDHGEHHIGTHD